MAVGVEISELTDVGAADAAAIGRLVGQLSSSAPEPTVDELVAIARNPGTTLLVARYADGSIIGMLTLLAFRIPTGVRARIEDVVVDAVARGTGVGEALMRIAVEKAAGTAATTVDLTSRESRDQANRLYERIGFVRRDTNVYRHTIEKESG